MYYGTSPVGLVPPRNATSLVGRVLVQIVPASFHRVTHVPIHISSVFSVVHPFTKITDLDLAPKVERESILSSVISKEKA